MKIRQVKLNQSLKELGQYFIKMEITSVHVNNFKKLAHVADIFLL